MSRKRPPPPRRARDDPRRKSRQLRAGDVLDGRYQLLRPVREGVTGVVFAAENLRVHVPVAVKVLHADVMGPAKAELAARLLREMRAVSRLDHRALVRVLDAGETGNGDPYLVMEMLRGESLKAAFEQHGPVKPSRALRILLPIAHGLAAAHEAKVMHRDVKPENIFLCQEGEGRIQPKLIGFGLAKSLTPEQERLTRAGQPLGSPEYMSPEQLRGTKITHRADVWAFSVTLYEVITGETPFRSSDISQLVRRILSDEPRPITDFRVGDETLWGVLRRGLAKDQADRWLDMHALGTALAAWLLEQGYTDDITGASLEGTWLSPGAGPGGKLDILAMTPSPTEQAAQRLGRATAGKRGAPPAARPRRDGSEEGVPTVVLEPSVKGSPRLRGGAAGKAQATGVGHAARRRRRWPLVTLWLLALAGVAGAVTGYLQVPLPGVPARVTRIGPWRVPWPRAAAPSDPPATTATSRSTASAPSASSTASRQRRPGRR